MKTSIFRYFENSPEIIRLVVMMYVQTPLSLRNVEDLLHERGIDICDEPFALLKKPIAIVWRHHLSQVVNR